MLIIGSNINTSIPGIDEMIEKRDRKALLEIAMYQISLGSDMLAINCGSRIDTEPDDIEWMFRTIQEEIEIPLCIDSPNPEAHRKGLEVHRHGRALVDAITAEQKRIDSILPLVKEHDSMVTVLLHDEIGMPASVEDRLRVMPRIAEAVKEYGIDPGNVYLDCLVFPLGVEHDNGCTYFESLNQIRTEYPEFKFSCGLNNISFGLPAAELLNMAFLSSCYSHGQDAVYIEIYEATAALIPALELIIGSDKDCLNYLQAFRDGRLNMVPENSSVKIYNS